VEIKTCLLCSVEIIKKPNKTWKAFNKQKYCSHKCYHLADKGSHNRNVQPNSLKNLIHGFKKGMIPWNKGLDTRPQCIFCNEKCSWKSKICKKCFRGKNTPFWKNGITPLYWKIRNSLKMNHWRKEVFERDKFACVMCGDNRGGNLNADHIISFSSILHDNKIDTFNKALKCKILWQISNGRTLCHSCHKNTENYGHLGGQKQIHFFKNTYS